MSQTPGPVSGYENRIASMPNQMANNATIGDLDGILEQYESVQVRSGAARIRDFLPDRRHREYREIACELIRVDLEYSFQRGKPKQLEEYRTVCPDLFADAEVLGQLAFEDYRLRCQWGDAVTPQQYAARYQVNTDGWPRSVIRSGVARSEWAADDRSAGSAGLVGDRLDGAGDFPELGGSFLGFQLIDELGRGAFARVYLAGQGDLSNRHVALKVTTRLSAEPDRLAQLQHTNIVPIYSVHRSGSLQAVCMPYFGATTLADVLMRLRKQSEIPRSGHELLTTITGAGEPTRVQPAATGGDSAMRIPPPSGCGWPAATVAFVQRAGYCDVMVWMVERLCRGLAHAHLRGIVHRDLKPANVLLTDDGQPMLLDFNLATSMQPAGRRASLVGGTLPYMAPEQIESLRTGSAVDARSDVFSMGVILFELLTRQHPFPPHAGSFETAGGEMVADRRAGPPSARAIEPRVSPGLDGVVRRCLDPDPDNRYRSAAELQEDLQRHLDHLPLRYAADYAPRERLTKWIRRHPRLASASTVMVISALLLLALVLSLVVQRHDIARLEATDQVRQLEKTVGVLRAPLTSPDIATASLQETVDDARNWLVNHHVDTLSGLKRLRPLERLDAGTRQAYRGRLQELFFMLANARHRQADRTGDRQQRATYLAEAIRLNRLAQAALSSGDPPRALLFQQAELLEASGKTPRAEAVRTRARRVPVRTTMDRYLLALDAMTGHRYRQALPLLEKVRRRTPRDFSIWLLTGNCLVGLGRLEEAEGCYTTCVALRDQSPWGYFRRGLCRLELHRYPGAEADFSQTVALKALASQAMITQALFNRAVARQRQGRWQEAVDDLTRAIDLGATETRIYFVRARLLDRLGQRQRAEADRRQGLTLMPTDEKSWIARGMARLRHDPQAALDDFRHALKLNPRSAVAMRNVAYVLAQRLHDDQQALAVLDDLAAVDPDDATVVAGQGVLAARIGQPDVALASADKALAIHRDDKTLYQIACLYALLAKADAGNAKYGRRAVTLLAEAVRQKPRWAKVAVNDPDLLAIRKLADFRTLTSAAIKLLEVGKSRPVGAPAEVAR